MKGPQTIKSGPGSLIVQSGGDTTVGMSAEDIRKIVESLADQLPKYAAIASEIVETRLKTFEDKILNRFSDSKAANPQAFADPDFQYLLGRSQHAFARSGDEETADVLIDLIAQRSMQDQRNRLALSLNDAVERSACLTKNEFAELSLVYLLKHTATGGLRNFRMLCEHLRDRTGPLLTDVSREESSYSYLAAQACAHVEVTAVSLLDILKSNYGGLISLGSPKEKYEKALGELFPEHFGKLIRPSIHGGDGYQIAAANQEVLSEAMENTPLRAKVKELWAIHSAGFMNQQQFVERAGAHFEDVGLLFDLWENTPLKHLQLTSVGTAIGYANLKRLCDFEADLSTWIK